MKKKCKFCGNEATLLCDMPNSYVITTAGFRREVFTYDNAICSSCAISVNGFDFCPDCVEQIKSAEIENRK